MFDLHGHISFDLVYHDVKRDNIPRELQRCQRDTSPMLKGVKGLHFKFIHLKVSHIVN